MRIALGIEYDGATFTGWQTQTGGRGVQDAVESALSQIAGSAIATICAGRTDSGVHALDQVIHFDTDADSATDGLGARRQPVSCRRQLRFSGRDRSARTFTLATVHAADATTIGS